MVELKDFIKISKVPGVAQFVLVNAKGAVAACDMKNPENAAQIVSTCGKNSVAVAKRNFKYLIFSRENKKNFFIFPVGSYYLGVFKQRNFGNNTLAENVLSFLQELVKITKTPAP